MSTVIDLEPTLDSRKLVGVNNPYERDWLAVTGLRVALESHRLIEVNDPYGRDQLGRRLGLRNVIFLAKQCVA